MDYYESGGVGFQSDYELLLESANRNRVGRMSIRGRREKVVSSEPSEERVRHGDFGPRLKDCCKHLVTL